MPTIYSDDDLNSAIQAGILSEDTATAFRQHAASRTAATAPDPDEENFRLITGFNDIFVVIACALLLVSTGWIVSAAMAPAAGALAVAAMSWGLAEFFTRRRHMALPSIVLLLTFVGGVFTACSLLGGLGKGGAVVALGSGAVTAAAAWLHWRRFHVPISVAAGAAAMAAVAITVLMAAAPDAADWIPAIMLVAGAIIFWLAMRWDSTDTLRQTRRSDVAFWLHLLAAPLLVHPVFALLGVYGGAASLPQTLIVVLLYLLIALVSLSIDRRALMVSALAYVLYAFSALLKQYGVVGLGFAITALGIGSALLLLSAFWQQSRARVVRRFPPALQRRLPPTR